jgi:hypothetical protein
MLVTLPLPLPILVAVNVKGVFGANVAVIYWLLDIVTIQVESTTALHPDQPTKI